MSDNIMDEPCPRCQMYNVYVAEKEKISFTDENGIRNIRTDYKCAVCGYEFNIWRKRLKDC